MSKKKKKPPRLDGLRLVEEEIDKMINKLITDNGWTKETKDNVAWVFRESFIGTVKEESHSVLSKEVEHIERKKLADGSVQEIFRTKRVVYLVIAPEQSDRYKLRFIVQDKDSYDTGTIRDMLARKNADTIRDEILLALDKIPP
ncbi:MAG: hypothetical protein ACFFCQ_12655 [Promethearchaeota archaeon]